MVLLIFISGCYAESQHVMLKSDLISLCPNTQLIYLSFFFFFSPRDKKFDKRINFTKA